MNDSFTIECRLFKAGELAAALGVKGPFVTQMKHAGFKMPGGRSTLRWALDWLKANPDFASGEPVSEVPKQGPAHRQA